MKNPIIIGAGVSGLVAAIELEKKGFEPIILEASDRVGGRVKSDYLNDYPIDHGFQVLLTEYPEAKRYLDYDNLDLVEFLPGSVIFKNRKKEKIGDPLREASFLWSTTFAKIGSLKDKRLIFQLSRAMKQKSIDSIFAETELTTLAYLEKYGFSKSMIHDFFQPFFAGIYLEENLDTSSRMFEFVFKMFGAGKAAIPREGMQAIPNQLAGQLTQSTIRYNTAVSHIENQTVHLESGESLHSDKIIIATAPTSIFTKKDNTVLNWKSCYNLYFDSTKSVLNAPIIGLLPGKESIVNNLHYLGDIYGNKGQENRDILSVTVIKKHKQQIEAMVREVKIELRKYCKIETGDLLKVFHIKKALPKLIDLKYLPSSEATILAPGIFTCGDHMANSSLNAAMASGRVAARLLSKAL